VAALLLVGACSNDDTPTGATTSSISRQSGSTAPTSTVTTDASGTTVQRHSGDTAPTTASTASTGTAPQGRSG
jgi:hypothetical protein